MIQSRARSYFDYLLARKTRPISIDLADRRVRRCQHVLAIDSARARARIKRSLRRILIAL